MVKLQNNAPNIKSSEVVPLFEFASKDKDVEALVILTENDHILDMFSKDDIEMYAILQPLPMSHKYILFVRSRLGVSLKEIVFHEICHLLQYEQGRLVFDTESKTYTFDGITYKNPPVYKERPWEKEAFAMQKELTKAYRKANKKCLFSKF